MLVALTAEWTAAMMVTPTADAMVDLSVLKMVVGLVVHWAGWMVFHSAVTTVEWLVEKTAEKMAEKMVEKMVVQKDSSWVALMAAELDVKSVDKWAYVLVGKKVGGTAGTLAEPKAAWSVELTVAVLGTVMAASMVVGWVECLVEPLFATMVAITAGVKAEP